MGGAREVEDRGWGRGCAGGVARCAATCNSRKPEMARLERKGGGGETGVAEVGSGS